MALRTSGSAIMIARWRQGFRGLIERNTFLPEVRIVSISATNICEEGASQRSQREAPKNASGQNPAYPV
jgi:hypothetical protein